MRGRLFSSIGEVLWYLSGTNSLSFIQYYVEKYKDESEDGVTFFGAYGPRLFNFRGNNQIINVLDLLRRKPTSRRAVIQLFDSGDLVGERKEIPCTCSLQFMIRRGRLDMFTNMRSNDAFLGLPHDIFAFTMIQEIFARSLGVELGTYKQAIGSLHLYDCKDESARAYLDEGLQSTINMPPIPPGDPWPVIEKVLAAESGIRNGEKIDAVKLPIKGYWRDIVRLLQIYALRASCPKPKAERWKRSSRAERKVNTLTLPYDDQKGTRRIGTVFPCPSR